MQNLERAYYFDIESNTVLRMLEVLGLKLTVFNDMILKFQARKNSNQMMITFF